ncbi:MAG: gliding motility lipoprotein GldD [Flavobacteriales bacterium]
MECKKRTKVLLPLTIILLFLFFFGSGCSENGTPKPKGYPRIELPEERDFRRTQKDCPFSFEIPDNAILTQKTVEKDRNLDTDCWFDLVYPRYHAQVHLTYKSLDGDLRKFVRQSHRLAYEHQVKARNILPERIHYDSNEVYGTKYRIKGNVASNLQFFITDSTQHFLRGSLYFMTEPNADSLRPVIDYIERDIDHMLKTLRWNKSS